MAQQTTIEVDRKALARLVGLARIDSLQKELAGLERKYGQEEGPGRRRRRRRGKKKGNGQGMPAARRAAISAGVRRTNRKKAKGRRQGQTGS